MDQISSYMSGALGDVCICIDEFIDEFMRPLGKVQRPRRPCRGSCQGSAGVDVLTGGVHSCHTLSV